MPKLIIISIAALAALAVAAALLVQAWDQEEQPTSLAFQFDSSDHAGWWSAGNTNVRESAESAGYDEANYGPISELPTASISVHHGGPEDDKPDDQCFFSFAYYDQPLDSLDLTYDNYEGKFTTGGSLKQIDSQQKTISTPEGEKTYDLRSYHTEVEAPGEYMSGSQVGFLELSKGHIEIRGTCLTPEDTALTSPVMDAVSLRSLQPNS